MARDHLNGVHPMIDHPKRDHGGNLADARARFGGAATDWLDLSTGINPVPYPVGALAPSAWACLPDASAFAAAESAARVACGARDGADIVAGAGASALIGLMPRLASPGEVAIPGPTYNEHAAVFRAAGWRINERPGPGTSAAVIVNPNNPDGRRWSVDELLLMAEAMPLLVVDESFIDLTPEHSLCPYMGADGAAREGLVVLRSFGKFYGLAGVRLGFAVTGPETAGRIREMLGPWAVSGPALELGARALGDEDWAEATRVRVTADAARLVALGRAAGWRLVGEAGLFATFETPDAAAAQDRLAQERIWSRIFPYSPLWLRLGLPGDEAGWQRLAAVLEG
jgi:cobalamin biosynthetic protein CobC